MDITVKNVEDYLALQPVETRTKLEKLRNTIKTAAPAAEEVISYGMPTYKLNGALVHFAGYKNHIGFYPTPGGIDAFMKELSAFELSKGTVRFPIEKALPIGLISKIVKFRVKENLKRQAKKMEKSNLRICSKGHKYYKSSDCPTCPICEKNRKPVNSFLSLLSAPARRALENKGITTLQQLSAYSEKDILKLHGMGPGSLPKLNSALKVIGLSFKIDPKN